jgi:predicted ATPase
MTFDEILAQVLDLLRREGRVSYRAIKRRFDLDDNDLEDLKDEIIAAKQSASDEQGRVLAHVEDTGERYYAAEVYRIKGELLLRQAIPDMPQAEACFQQALAVARHQQARSWELRAAMSLSRLWQRQGKHAAARELLTPIYGWFSEGFDAADLQEAKALLEALGEGQA